MESTEDTEPFIMSTQSRTATPREAQAQILLKWYDCLFSLDPTESRVSRLV